MLGLSSPQHGFPVVCVGQYHVGAHSSVGDWQAASSDCLSVRGSGRGLQNSHNKFLEQVIHHPWMIETWLNSVPAYISGFFSWEPYPNTFHEIFKKGGWLISTMVIFLPLSPFLCLLFMNMESLPGPKLSRLKHSGLIQQLGLDILTACSRGGLRAACIPKMSSAQAAWHLRIIFWPSENSKQPGELAFKNISSPDGN